MKNDRRIVKILLISGCLAAAVHSSSIKICGNVTDRQTGLPLAHTNIQFIRAKTGCLTDESGRFCVELPDRNDTLVFRYIGYELFYLPVNFPLPSGFREISLTPSVIQLHGVTIEALHDTHHNNMSFDPSARRIHSELLQRMPFVLNPDVLRVIQRMPGVSSTGEVAPQFSVRGGNPDQNLIILDDAVLYYPYHFLGIVSSFNADMIENIDFSLGGFSARYGDRLSSVLSLHSRTPVKSFSSSIRLGLTGLDGTFGGKTGRMGWLVSGRTGFVDAVRRFVKIEFPYAYHDLYAKVEYKPATGHMIRLSWFRNEDKQALEEKTIEKLISATDQDQMDYGSIINDSFGWVNEFYSIRWDAALSSKLLSSLQAFQSYFTNHVRYQNYVDWPEFIDSKFIDAVTTIEREMSQFNAEYGSDIKNRLVDRTIRIHLNHIPDSTLKFEYGIQISRLHADYQWDNLYDFGEHIYIFFDHAESRPFQYKRNFHSFAGYGEAQFRLSDRWDARCGIRLTRWSLYDEVFSEPRLSFRYRPSEDWAAKLALSRHTQALSTSLEEGLVQFLPLYFPVEGQNPETADHLVGSVSYFKPSGLEFSLSAYIKYFRGLLKSSGPGQFVQTPGRSAGLEAEMKINAFGFRLWLSYVLSHSTRTWNGFQYDTNFDQRHRLQLFGCRALGRKWEFSFAWEFHTGQPYHPGIYYALVPINRDGTFFERYEMDVPRGRIRYPPFHRLDIQLTRIRREKGFSVEPYLAIQNVYNKKNVLFYTDQEIKIESVGDKTTIKGMTYKYFYLPIIPSLGVKISW